MRKHLTLAIAGAAVLLAACATPADPTPAPVATSPASTVQPPPSTTQAPAAPPATVTVQPPVTVTAAPPPAPVTVTEVAPPIVIVTQPAAPSPSNLGVYGEPGGLLCQDLIDKGYNNNSMWLYWTYWGHPSQMDIDHNGNPCETLIPGGLLGWES